ncbi:MULTISPECIES: Crp/Fnr family transcriptional regulator [unclassified Flavobacterium]|uniref:Crp/Fnr family transcriptional regulator n=1 Tax=unclassified Flavobacterium TaxID=196869 RepID=UPI003F92C701
MFEVFFSHILKKVSLTENDKENIKTYFIAKKLRKKNFLLEEGEVCKYLSFVEKGLLKSYNIDQKGVEHINMFASEGWWIADICSFFSAEKAVLNIDALEDAELLMISLQDFEKMTLEVPIMDRYFRILFQNSLFTKEKRLMSAITHTAEEKYILITQNNPELIQRVPQHLIASYLGITPETLSRIKKNILIK